MHKLIEKITEPGTAIFAPFRFFGHFILKHLYSVKSIIDNADSNSIIYLHKNNLYIQEMFAPYGGID